VARRLVWVLTWLCALAAPHAHTQSVDTLASIDALDLLIKNGKYAAAEQAARTTLADVESRSGAESAPAAHVINRLADALLRQGKTGEETERLIDRAVAIETRLEPATRELGAAQGNKATLVEARGDFESAKLWYERTAGTMRAALGPEHRETLMAVKDLGMAWNNLGEYAKARALVDDALAIRSRQEPQHADVAILRHNLGAIDWQLGNYTAARDSFTAAADGLARAFGGDHPHVASALEGLGVIQHQLGEHAESRTTLRRVLAIRENVLPPGHPLIGQTYVNLGDVLMSMGDYPSALRAFEHGLAIWEHALGPNHPQLLIALTDLAVLRDRTGDHAGARQAMRRGIAIREKANGPDDPDLVIPLTQLANMLADAGRWAEARKMYARARSLGARTRGPDHPYVAAADIEEGLRLAARGNPAAAAPLIEHARAAQLGAFGPDHPTVAVGLDASARLAAVRGATADAVAGAIAAEALTRQHFQATVAVLPENEALLYAEERARSQDLALFLALGTPPADTATIERLWDVVVRSRALVLEGMSWRRDIVTAADTPVSRETIDEAADARARLAQLFVRGPSRERPADFARELADARQAKDRADERLAAASAAYQRDRALRASGFDAIREALPERAALVSFVRYETGLFTPTARAHRFAYAAFVLPARDAAPRLIPIGSAIAIDSLIARLRQQVRAEATAPPMGAARREAEYRTIAADVRRRVWDPVARHLAHPSRVLIVPDGALHLLDFATLPIGVDRYLVDAGPTVHYATAERDLIPDAATPGIGLLALGAPAFDRSPAPLADVPIARLRSECAAAPAQRFTALPESGREAEAIVRMWPEADGPALLLRGAAASESALKAAAPRRRVLHLATHGFVMGEGCTSAGRGAGARTGAAQTLASSPLLGAGLVLAGASRRLSPSTAAEDGILTAEEISGLDLRGVQWAVLSACDSGTGVARAGEGIFGLRRAFQLAGVRTVIVSLWPVEDRAARSWMERLYSARLTRHRSTDEAVREASRSALADRRKAGRSTHPRYWSGFVAAGDWR